MDIKKTIKKIGAVLGVAAVAGLTAVSAATLADYPAPFVKDGKFDAEVVVGEYADAKDVVGAVDIGASLQYEMRQQVTAGAGAEVEIDEGYKFDPIGSEFQYDETLCDVDTSLGSEDLNMLSDEVYEESKGDTNNDLTYTQKLSFTPSATDDEAGVVTYRVNKELEEEPYLDYLFFTDSAVAYNYEVVFDDPVEYTTTLADIEDDFVGSKLVLQGNDYTVTEVEATGVGNLDSITLMAGDTTVWLVQNTPITKWVDGQEHTIEVIDVTDDEDSCGVDVDGKTEWIDTGSSAEINGIDIGVLDAKAVHAQLQDVDICELNLGANEIKLEDGGEVEVDGQEIEDVTTLVTFDETAGTAELNGFDIDLTFDDDKYVGEGEGLVDPVFGNFKFQFEGMMKDTEMIDFESASDEAMLTFNNIEGNEINIPLMTIDEADYADLNADADAVDVFVAFGEEEDIAGYEAVDLATVATVQGMVFTDGDECTVNANTNCDDVMFVAIDADEVGHILQLDDVDWAEDEYDFTDLTTGKTYEDKDSGVAVDIGHMEITLTINDDGDNVEDATDAVTFTDINNGDTTFGTATFKTEKGGAVVLTPAADSENQVIEFVEDFDSAAVPEEITLTTSYDETTDEKIEVAVLVAAAHQSGNENADTVDKDSDYKTEETIDWGTIVTWDEEEDDDVTIEYPEDPADAQVFVAPVDAEVVAGASGDAYNIKKINYIAKLDSEVSLGNDNYIAVGGPCINTIAAAAMGNPEDCEAGFEEGKAVLKLFDADDTVVMVVAGMVADDTRAAAQVLTNFDVYSDKFEGTEAEIITAEVLQ